jgi:hypothetical protein
MHISETGDLLIVGAIITRCYRSGYGLKSEFDFSLLEMKECAPES